LPTDGQGLARGAIQWKSCPKDSPGMTTEPFKSARDSYKQPESLLGQAPSPESHSRWDSNNTSPDS